MIFGTKSMIFGAISMIFGAISMIFGTKSMIFGAISMIFGAISIISGTKSMIFGAISMICRVKTHFGQHELGLEEGATEPLPRKRRPVSGLLGRLLGRPKPLAQLSDCTSVELVEAIGCRRSADARRTRVRLGRPVEVASVPSLLRAQEVAELLDVNGHVSLRIPRRAQTRENRLDRLAGFLICAVAQPEDGLQAVVLEDGVGELGQSELAVPFPAARRVDGVDAVEQVADEPLARLQLPLLRFVPSCECPV